MNLTYFRIDLLRSMREVWNVAFVIAMPVVMYVLFGSLFGQADETAGRGNVRFYVMCAMVAYGAAVAATGISGSAAIELMQGWGRQLALTPLRPAGFVATKVAVALVVAFVGVGAVTVAGLLTDATADPPWVWVATFAIAWLGSVLFALYGLAMAQLFRSESAVGISSASLALLGFFGNLFVPLSGTALDIARWTPMYGYAGLVRYPLLEGASVTDASVDPLWQLVVNAVAWAAVFAAVAVWAVRRGRRRQ